VKPLTTFISANRFNHRSRTYFAFSSKPRLDWFIDAMRYFAASGVALAVDFGSYIALIRLFGYGYLTAATAGFTLGLATIYLLSIGFVFSARRVTSPVAEFILFAGIGVCGLLLNSVILYIAVEIFHCGHEVSKMISAACVFCFNFGLRKSLLFSKKVN
jgi:putative flippase GtrA